ncbi:MAG: sulfate adenylyltransferase subunit CysN [Candidatus Acidiferrum sp.]
MLSPASNDRGDFATFLEQDLNTELLRFTTAGSVDDGKSTLIGRLLHDSKSVYEDQLASIKKSRVNRSSGPIDFSLLTDGLSAEREQGITIDVAYRYFSTPRRKFIIADTPGHEQYTRNMATGASTADLAVILIDGTKGLLTQTRRHAYISSLLGISSVIGAINKMDLVDYSEEVFHKLKQDFEELAAQLGIQNVQCVPISALEGDNVVKTGKNMPWYQGPTLLEYLETVTIPVDVSVKDLRLPVQTVIRPDANFRGFAGRIASGTLRPGDTVLALPSGQKARVQSIVSFDGDLSEAFSPMSVTVRLEREIDLSRGDMLVSQENPPEVARKFQAMVVWLNERKLEVGRSYLLKHAGRQTKARVNDIYYRVNVNTLGREDAATLEMNHIASVGIEANVPLFIDTYAHNRTTGSFILIDALSNATVGAGMIQEVTELTGGLQAHREGAHKLQTLRSEDRYERHGHYPGAILLENRAALATRIERALFDAGFEVLHLPSKELAGDKLLAAVAMARDAGVVLIYSGATLNAETKARIATESAGRIFEFAAPQAPAEPSPASSDEESFREIIDAVQSLRIGHPRQNVN